MTTSFFELQLKDYNETGHEGWEHYRYGAFINWLKAHQTFTDQQIEEVAELINDDNDKPMAKGFAKELINSGKLTELQIIKLKILASLS
ncbi:hypothetical protein [Saccharospirillum alexandrii]|uniref:hypothetical protein n=1 Tax=Saccharospirillum alexandrii TaxID=2448477 RepID=UPI000FD6D1D0|nr:hypothetical protein [Saccharospirillum alexandrii]